MLSGVCWQGQVNMENDPQGWRGVWWYNSAPHPPTIPFPVFTFSSLLSISTMYQTRWSFGPLRHSPELHLKGSPWTLGGSLGRQNM